MSLEVTASPLIVHDPKQKADRAFSVLLTYEDSNVSGPFAYAVGRTAQEAALRAALIQMAVNKTRPAPEFGYIEGGYTMEQKHD